MKKVNLLVSLMVVFLGATLASAQATRTWVSGVGDDANPCSRTAPCKTFAGAISKTAPGGEIDALDPGGFGALTITKSITLDGGGGQVASVLVQGTNGIVVAAGANDVVIIRNMRLDGLLGGGNGNAGLNGIRWISGKQLVVENCVIFGFSQNGIDIEKSDGGQAHIINTNVENNGPNGSQLAGVFISNTVNTVSVDIDGLHTVGNTNGVLAKDFSKVSIRDSIAAGNTTDGFVVQSNSSPVATPATMDIVSSMASNNTVAGVQAGGAVTGGASTMSITNVSSYGNGLSFSIGPGGTINTSANNYFFSNIANPATGLTTVNPR